MKESLRLAGFFAAHAVGYVSFGEGFCPIIGSPAREGDQWVLSHIEHESNAAAVAEGRALLKSNPDAEDRMVLVFDGFVNLPSGRIDAVMVECAQYRPTPGYFKVAVPYRNTQHPLGFAVHRPKFLAWEAVEQLEDIAQSFQDGIDEHTDGARIWSDHLDQSV